MLRGIRTFLTAVVWCLAATELAAQTAAPDEIRQKIDQVRGIRPSAIQADNDAVNRRIDEVWSFLEKNKDGAVPIVIDTLKLELGKTAPDQFLLLDLGAFLLSSKAAPDPKLAVQVLARLDGANATIAANFAQFARFAHMVAKSGDIDALAHFDRLFLANTATAHIFAPPHVTNLDPTLICVFLYGPYGDAGQQHLHRRLTKGDPAALRVLEILTWIGTERSVPAVSAYVKSTPDRETVLRAMAILAKLGGKSGRAKVLEIEGIAADAQTREQLQQSRAMIEQISYATIAASLEQFEPRPSPSPSPAEIDLRLAKMFDNYGVDHETHPLDVLDSTLADAELLDLMLRIRSRMFHRLNNHALDDVLVTNAIVNALQFGRPAKP
jgi:hypothetical protein